MELYDLAIPASCNHLGEESSVKLSMNLDMKGKLYAVRWAVKAKDEVGPEVLNIPLFRIPKDV
jgi:hypothetical protein